MSTFASIHEAVPPDVLDRSITGRRLTGRTLREELAGPTRLVVFLRHFG